MANKNQELFRKIPAVDRLLLAPIMNEALALHPRPLVLKAVNQILDELREKIQTSEIIMETDLDLEPVSALVMARLNQIAKPSLIPVINATGVVIHTNLGRSLLAESVLKKFAPIAGGYSNLEYDLVRGERGSRYSHVEEILKELTQAEAAMVVNNNAAAVLLALDTLAKGREVVISRGQLVEIGGSFRIPDVMRRSGAKMVEVGTTNKTHLRDYEEVIGPETALLLKVHTSNFQIVGFTEELSVSELAGIGNRHGIPVMEDLGSGCLVDFSEYGLIKEPTVQEVLSQGADLVTFSGDKLLGGPQAGIILGRKDLVEAIRKNQLSRALRIDKLTLLALEETLRLYRDKRTAIEKIPTLRMICETYSSLNKKAGRLMRLIGSMDSNNFSIELIDGGSKVGGGALPLLELPSRLICLSPKAASAQFMERWLRSYDPPVISRVEKERVLLDVRTIKEGELKTVAQAIRALAEPLVVNKCH
ncbi:L-seryl-tRNA(Sec) selenium transferase [uncultured Desulfobacterium sp.]|uniref:L-seryl-tRNA(Sec) selenium transferase n=1 Tax=uncultured Desulfobacterium sp. TaxID=201089 RepID=A0A445MS03_9BACT|nr:L-seryl-tRNA(Sec) selenium transferase [uncultured Desulfobacterium sp.]